MIRLDRGWGDVPQRWWMGLACLVMFTGCLPRRHILLYIFSDSLMVPLRRRGDLRYLAVLSFFFFLFDIPRTCYQLRAMTARFTFLYVLERVE